MKRKHILIALVMIVATFFMGTFDVDATSNVPDNLVINNYKAGRGNNPLNIDKNITVKQTSDGKYVYCIDYVLKRSDGKTYEKVSATKDLGLAYIVNAGYSNKNETDYFITQTAVWLYLEEKGEMTKDTTGTISTLREAVYSTKNDNNEAAKKIRDLISNAKKASKKNYYFNVDDSNISFDLTKNKEYYESTLIEVSTNFEDYDVTFENAPKGTTYKKTSEGVYVYILASRIDEVGKNFKVKITGDLDVYSTYIYNPLASGYQPVAVPYVETVSITTNIKANIEETIVSISKKDITNDKELAGATLVLRNEDNEIVDTWVSTEEAHIIYNLPVGKYTLTEKIAPKGYELSSETIEFEITEVGVEKTVTMYNKPKEEVVEVPVEPTSSFTSYTGSIIGIIIIGLGSMLIFRSTKENAR